MEGRALSDVITFITFPRKRQKKSIKQSSPQQQRAVTGIRHGRVHTYLMQAGLDRGGERYLGWRAANAMVSRACPNRWFHSLALFFAPTRSKEMYLAVNHPLLPEEGLTYGVYVSSERFWDQCG